MSGEKNYLKKALSIKDVLDEKLLKESIKRYLINTGKHFLKYMMLLSFSIFLSWIILKSNSSVNVYLSLNSTLLNVQLYLLASTITGFSIIYAFMSKQAILNALLIKDTVVDRPVLESHLLVMFSINIMLFFSILVNILGKLFLDLELQDFVIECSNYSFSLSYLTSNDKIILLAGHLFTILFSVTLILPFLRNVVKILGISICTEAKEADEK